MFEKKSFETNLKIVSFETNLEIVSVETNLKQLYFKSQKPDNFKITKACRN